MLFRGVCRRCLQLVNFTTPSLRPYCLLASFNAPESYKLCHSSLTASSATFIDQGYFFSSILLWQGFILVKNTLSLGIPETQIASVVMAETSKSESCCLTSSFSWLLCLTFSRHINGEGRHGYSSCITTFTNEHTRNTCALIGSNRRGLYWLNSLRCSETILEL